MPGSSGEIYIEIFGGRGEIFYNTLRNAVEASRILWTDYKRRVLAVPVASVFDIGFDLLGDRVVIRLGKRVYTRDSAPSIEWFIERVLRDLEERGGEELQDLRTFSEEPVMSSGQECVVLENM